MSLISLSHIRMILALSLAIACNDTAASSLVFANTCALQGDGKVLVAGVQTIDKTEQIIVARYHHDGYLDTTFGGEGIVTTALGTRCQAWAIAVQPDEKIIVAGCAYIGVCTQVAMVRYTPCGDLDTAFNGTGIVTTPIGNGAMATCIGLDRDDTIVVGGVSVHAGTPRFLAVRYTSDGTRDDSFGSQGIITTQIGVRAKAYGLTFQSDGKIVIGGFSSDGKTEEQCTLIRYTSAGALDKSFGNHGIVKTAVGKRSHALALAVHNDDSILVAGFSDKRSALVRYTAAGFLDTSFNGTGMVCQSFGARAQFHAVTIDVSGRAVASGMCDKNLLLVRYHGDGSWDSSFGVGVETRSLTCNAQAIALQSDGQIIVVANEQDRFTVKRYAASGERDVTWADQRKTRTSYEKIGDIATRLWHEESSGVPGGTFAAGLWQTRALNVLYSPDTQVTLHNDQFILAPGTYEVHISAPAYRVGNHQIRLYNATDRVAALWGTTAFSHNESGSMTNSIVNGVLLIKKMTTFEVQHRATRTELMDGFGIAADLGGPEIYTTVRIMPLS
jgi:uncharacterized delta-60 repeat protein